MLRLVGDRDRRLGDLGPIRESNEPRDPEPDGFAMTVTVFSERGEADDDTGVVEFIARGKTKGGAFAQRERSRFRKLDGRWYYTDGKVHRGQR